jgi:hypothetical protein
MGQYVKSVEEKMDSTELCNKNTAMFTENKVTEVYCIADDFCKLFDA